MVNGLIFQTGKKKYQFFLLDFLLCYLFLAGLFLIRLFFFPVSGGTHTVSEQADFVAHASELQLIKYIDTAAKFAFLRSQLSRLIT